jgi:hypothetical protein
MEIKRRFLMNVKRSSLFWGILLVGGGAVALAQQLGYLDQFPESAWMWVFALVSVVAFISYFTSGLKEWGWLFPAGIFGGLAVTIALAVNNVDSAAVASPLFFGLFIPFAAAYLTDRTKNWWALIPGGVMLFLAMTTLLVDNVGGEWVGSLFLFLIGLSFLVVYINNRTRTWALLVAYILGSSLQLQILVRAQCGFAPSPGGLRSEPALHNACWSHRPPQRGRGYGGAALALSTMNASLGVEFDQVP